MESPQFIRAQLVNRTNADCSTQEVKHNRYHFYLKFEESIGWDWLEGQVEKCSAELDTSLEAWEIHPSGMHSFELEVREVERREGIDTDQCGLTDFDE